MNIQLSHKAIGEDEWKKASSEIRQSAVDRNICQEDWPLILSPLSIGRNEIEQLSRDLHRIYQLLVDLPHKFFYGDEEAFIDFCKVPKKHFHLFKENKNSDICNSFCRWDLMFDGLGWKILELNVGSNVGGANVANLPAVVQGVLSGLDWTVSGECLDPNRLLAEIVGKTLRKSGSCQRLAIVEDGSCYHKYRKMFEHMASKIQSLVGIETVAVSAQDLEVVDGKNLTYKGLEIGGIYRFFTTDDIDRDPEVYNPLMDLVISGEIVCPLSFEHSIFGTKSLLALLKKSQCLEEEDRRLVDKYIPETRLVEAMDEKILSSKDDLLIKPIDGHGGHGIVCGWEVSYESWEKELRHAAENPGQFIVQRKVSSANFDLTVGQLGQPVQQGASQLVLGVFESGGRFGGAIVRSQFGSDSVVNVENGAAASGLLITSR